MGRSFYELRTYELQWSHKNGRRLNIYLTQKHRSVKVLDLRVLRPSKHYPSYNEQCRSDRAAHA